MIAPKFQNEKVQGSKKNKNTQTIKEKPQKNGSGALRRYYKRGAGAAPAAPAPLL